MLERILVIDDSEEFWRLTVYFVGRQWPDAQVEWFQPATHGKPDADFPWADYHVVLIDYALGLEGETGLDWLSDFTNRPEFPPAILLSDAASDEVVAEALALGASSHLRKDNLSAKVLNAVIRDGLRKRSGAPAAAPVGSAQDANSDRPPGDPGEATLEDTVTDHSTDGVVRTAAADDSQHTFDPHPRVPGYKLVSTIGRGGMSTVYLAERSEDQRQVILKVLFTDGREQTKALKRFMLEYKLIGWLRHPNVVQIYERAFAKDFAYIAMEYFENGDLAQRIDRGITKPDALYYLRQIAEGLKPVHERGIVHRDLKPGNVLFRDDDTLAITDFGIAKELNVEYSITGHDGVLGTPYYMSPEQAKETNIDQRSDLYSLGVVLFEMVAGEKPYKGDNVAMIVHSHLYEPVPKLPSESAEFQPLIEGLLAKDPDDRFQKCEELLAALDWL